MQTLKSFLGVLALLALSGCTIFGGDTINSPTQEVTQTIAQPPPTPPPTTLTEAPAGVVSTVKVVQWADSCGLLADRSTRVGCTKELTLTPYDSAGKEVKPPATAIVSFYQSTHNGNAHIERVWSDGYNITVKADSVGDETFTGSVGGISDSWTLTVKP